MYLLSRLSLYTVLVAFLLGLSGSQIVEPACLAAGRPDPCELFGAVFVEKDRYRARYLVYVEEENDYRADLWVFKENNALFADKPGMWFFTEGRGFADFTIAFVKDRNIADFTIYYTNKEHYAGCGHR